MKRWLQFIVLGLATSALAYAPGPKPVLSEAGGWRSDFVFDGLGRRRIERDFVWAGSAGLWVQTNETHFVFDGMLPIQERDQSNNVRVTYTRGLDLSGTLQGAGGIGGLLARTDQGALNAGLSTAHTFYHSDGAGNVTALLNGSQNVVARYLYEPYGRVLGKWGPLADANVMQFSSMPLHRQSGLSLYAFRGYDPSLQRWLTRDPIGEVGGLNLYGFVANSPLVLIDPFGLDNMYPPQESINANSVQNAAPSMMLVGYLNNPASMQVISTGGDSALGLGGMFTDYIPGMSLAAGLINAPISIYGGARDALDPNLSSSDRWAGGLDAAGNTILMALPFLKGKACPTAKPGPGSSFFGYDNPTKLNRGGLPQPYDPATGRFLPYSSNPGLAYSPFANLSSGFLQGYGSASSGVPMPPALSNYQAIGQFVGRMIAKIAGLF